MNLRSEDAAHSKEIMLVKKTAGGEVEWHVDVKSVASTGLTLEVADSDMYQRCWQELTCQDVPLNGYALDKDLLEVKVCFISLLQVSRRCDMLAERLQNLEQKTTM